MDRGAWWAAVHRVAQSQTRLKRHSMHALEKEMATHSSFLAWRIPGMEKPGGLLSMELHRVRHSWIDLAATAAVWLVCVLVCFSLGLSCMGIFVSLGLGWLFSFPCCGNFKNFLKLFVFLFFFWDPYNSNVGEFDMVKYQSLRGLWDFPQLFSFFLLYSALQKLFPTFYLPAH